MLNLLSKGGKMKKNHSLSNYMQVKYRLDIGAQPRELFIVLSILTSHGE